MHDPPERKHPQTAGYSVDCSHCCTQKSQHMTADVHIDVAAAAVVAAKGAAAAPEMAATAAAAAANG